LVALSAWGACLRDRPCRSDVGNVAVPTPINTCLLPNSTPSQKPLLPYRSVNVLLPVGSTKCNLQSAGHVSLGKSLEIDSEPDGVEVVFFGCLEDQELRLVEEIFPLLAGDEKAGNAEVGEGTWQVVVLYCRCVEGVECC